MAKIIHPDGREEPITDLSLESLQKAVGGYIELHITHEGKKMYVNEEGVLKNLPFNYKASAVHSPYCPIVGSVVLLEEGECYDN